MTSTKPAITVSVLISTYNRGHFLAQCLDSLLAQTRPAEEIIVVDDGSTDDTRSVVNRYGSAVRYFHQDNQGKAVALNFAIPRASGSHVCIFDDDDVMLEDALERHVAFLTARPDIDYTYSGKYFYDAYTDERSDIWDRTQWRVGQLDSCPPGELLIRTMEWNGTLMQGMLVPVRCLQAVGLFAEWLLRTQDYDMMLKLARRFRGASIDAISFVHRNHAGPRGPGNALHDENKRHAVWHEYDRRLFRALREELSLAEYLPRSESLAPLARLNEEQYFEALHQRAVIMFKRGLFAEGGQDIRRILDDCVLNAAQRERVMALVQRSANIGVADYVVGAMALAQELAKASSGRDARLVRRAALQGFYWGLRGAVRRRKTRHVYDFIRALARLGPASLA